VQSQCPSHRTEPGAPISSNPNAATISVNGSGYRDITLLLLAEIARKFGNDHMMLGAECCALKIDFTLRTAARVLKPSLIAACAYEARETLSSAR